MTVPMATTVFFSILPNPSARFPPKIFLGGPLRSRTLTLSLGFDRRRGRGGGVVEASRRKEEEDAFLALEAEVLEFTEGSENPDAFPTEDELVKARRKDLAEAIARSGRWLASGLDSKDPTSSSSSPPPPPLEEEEEGIEEEEASPSSGAGGLMEKDGGEKANFEGILSRLKMCISLCFGVGDKSREKEIRGEVTSEDFKFSKDDAMRSLIYLALLTEEMIARFGKDEIIAWTGILFAFYLEKEEEGIEEESSPSSGGRRSMEKDGGEEAVIEGIKSRLEMGISLCFGVGVKISGKAISREEISKEDVVGALLYLALMTEDKMIAWFDRWTKDKMIAWIDRFFNSGRLTSPYILLPPPRPLRVEKDGGEEVGIEGIPSEGSLCFGVIDKICEEGMRGEVQSEEVKISQEDVMRDFL